MQVLEKKMRKFRGLYELLFADYRIKNYRISEKLGYRSVSAILEEAARLQIIMGPMARTLSFSNLLEYVYLFNSEDPDGMYEKYRLDPRVIYNARIAGYNNSLVISREEIDIEGDITVKGPRSDYHVSFAPNQSFEQALLKGLERIEAFSPDSYSPKRFLKNHWNETVKWDENDEKIFNHLKYNLRKKLGPLIKEQHISKNMIYSWFETLHNRCTIVTAYFPESYLNYVSYLYTFNTDYEDFIIEVFSELPTTTISFKVADTLFLYVYAPREYIMFVDPYSSKGIQVPLLEKQLLNGPIVRKKTRSIIENSWNKII